VELPFHRAAQVQESFDAAATGRFRVFTAGDVFVASQTHSKNISRLKILGAVGEIWGTGRDPLSKFEIGRIRSVSTCGTQMDEEAITNLCIVLLVVLYLNGQRDRHHLTRSALLLPTNSPWCRLQKYGDDTSFLHITGFNRDTFHVC
jgi:hypothetical protein